MNPRLREKVYRISSTIKSEPYIAGIVVYGSIGRGEDDELSDIDMIIYYDDRLLRNEDEAFAYVHGLVSTAIEASEGVEYSFTYRGGKAVYYTRSGVWIEVVIHPSSKIPVDTVFIVESRIRDPTDAVIYDKDGSITRGLIEAWFHPSDPEIMKRRINETVDHFIYYLHLYTHYRFRGDRFRAYMNYTIMMYKLAGILAAAAGEVYNLYGPWFLFEKTLKNGLLAEKFFKTASLYDASPNQVREAVIDLINQARIMAEINNKVLYSKLSDAMGMINKILDEFAGRLWAGNNA